MPSSLPIATPARAVMTLDRAGRSSIAGLGRAQRQDYAADIDCQACEQTSIESELPRSTEYTAAMQADLRLYGNTPATSPYVMSVFVALEEKGLSYELELLDLGKGEQHRPEFVGHSITNRVPTLRHGSGWISESLAILEYLEERFPPPEYPRLYPADLFERARVRMALGLIRSDFMPIREERSTETVFQGKPIKPLSDTAEAARVRLVRIAAALVPEGRQSIASGFSIADVDLAMMLQRLVHNKDQVPDRLAEYVKAIWQRPSVQKWLVLARFRAAVS
jgi:glutathione S-transferase